MGNMFLDLFCDRCGNHFSECVCESEEDESCKEFLKEYCDFSGGNVYIVSAISRSKENEGVSSSSEIVLREVLRDERDVDRRFNRFLYEVGEVSGRESVSFHVYVSVNPRDSFKTFYNFKKRLEGWCKDEFFGDESVERKVQKLDRYWISELEKPENRGSTRFLWDLDVKDFDERDRLVRKLKDFTEVFEVVETVNGFHVVSGTFNYNELPFVNNPELDLELHTDGFLFLTHVDKEGGV